MHQANYTPIRHNDLSKKNKKGVSITIAITNEEKKEGIWVRALFFSCIRKRRWG